MLLDFLFSNSVLQYIRRWVVADPLAQKHAVQYLMDTEVIASDLHKPVSKTKNKKICMTMGR